MSKLRHIALSVPDLEKAASFYEGVFDMKRVGEAQTAFGSAISLSDGVVNLTLLNFPTDESAGDERGKDFVGLHHMGFVVDDLAKTRARIEGLGGKFHKELKGNPEEGVDFEQKYRDRDGIVFDISDHGWRL